MSPRQPSIVWTYFTKSASNTSLVKCTLCDATLSSLSTSNLLKHLREKHRQEISPHLWKGDTPGTSLRQKGKEPLGADAEADVAAASIAQDLVEDPPPEPGKQCIKKDLGDSDDYKVVSSRLGFVKKRRHLMTPRKLRSIAWKCFKKSELNEGLAVCTICGSRVRQTCAGTSNLLKHILNRHPSEYELMISDRGVAMASQQLAIKSKFTSPKSRVATKRRSRSIMWKYFAKCSLGSSQVLCTFCGRMLKQPLGSTSNLVKHLVAKHHREYKKLFPEDVVGSFDESVENSAETDDDETIVDNEDANRASLDEIKEEVLLNGVQMKLSDGDHELNFALFELEEENGEDNPGGISEMMKKIQPIWQKYCEEREKQFNTLMIAKKKEIEETQKSMGQFQQQLCVLAKEVKEHELKRKLELDRQEEVESKCLLERDAMSRKWKYRMAFFNDCSLVKDALSGKIFTTDERNHNSDCVLDSSDSNQVASPGLKNDDENNCDF